MTLEMGQYIDKPGVDSAEILQDGRLYPVVMSIPLGGDGSPTSAGSVPGLNIPLHDTVVITEDSTGKLSGVTYSLGGTQVAALGFTYSDHTLSAPYSTTTIVRS